MLDFTSALYLDMRHPSDTLAPFAALSTGRPAPLGEPPVAAATAAAAAGLIGHETALLYPSTLHAFWDLGGSLDPARDLVLVDDGSYPIAAWGLGRHGPRATPVVSFRHHDGSALRRAIAAGAGRRPLVVCDGFCPGCGRFAPVAEYLAGARGAGGRVVIDDTQGLGIFGHAPGTHPPYGRGGGGTRAALGLAAPELLVVASAAKGFGVPITVLAGPAAVIDSLAEQGLTRMHCSPPSQAHVGALARALAINAARGDRLRAELGARVLRLRGLMAGAGVGLGAGTFAVQTLARPGTWGERSAGAIYHLLLRRGVRVLWHRPDAHRRAALSLIVTVAHRERDLEIVAGLLGQAMGSTGIRRGACAGKERPCGRLGMACN